MYMCKYKTIDLDLFKRSTFTIRPTFLRVCIFCHPILIFSCLSHGNGKMSMHLNYTIILSIQIHSLTCRYNIIEIETHRNMDWSTSANLYTIFFQQFVPKSV